MFIKYMKEVIATANVAIEEKTLLLDRFKDIVYSHSEESLKRNIQAFKNNCFDIEVTPGRNKNAAPLVDYYEANWESCESKWVLLYRSKLVTLNDRTNNRVERMFRCVDLRPFA